MGFLLNRRNAFRTSASEVFSSWTFDVTKTTYDNVSVVPYTSAAGAAPSGTTNFKFMKLVNGGESLVAGYGGSYIYRYEFDPEHPGEINYLGVGYSARSVNSSNYTTCAVDHEGKNWFSAYQISPRRIRKLTTDSAFDVDSVAAFSTSTDTLSNVLPDVAYGVAISNDGKSLFALTQDSTRSLTQFSLASKNLLSSALLSYTSIPMVSFDSETSRWVSFFFAPDGYRIVFVGGTRVYVFDLSVAWDISTMVLNGYFASSSYGSITGGCINDEGTKLYLSSSTSNAIYQFSLSE